MADLFRAAPRQGPGEDRCTRKALRELGVLPGAAPRALDIGCGTGAQTAVLAETTAGPIVAVDLLPEFLEEARKRLSGHAERISLVRASMEALPFTPERFDLILCEGAAYHLGLSRALGLWRPLLAPGGRIALTELTLFPHAGETVRAYWKDAYPRIGFESENKAVFEREGFVPQGTFPLPREAWAAYYDGVEAAVPAFLGRRGHSAEALALAGACREEAAFWRLHGEEYGYVFYLAEKA